MPTERVNRILEALADAGVAMPAPQPSPRVLGICKVAADLIAGGKAAGKDVDAVAKDNAEKLGEPEGEVKPKVEDAVSQGRSVELEHTDDAAKAEEIAKDHVEEAGPEYYNELAKVEDKLKAENEGKLGDPEYGDKIIILQYLKDAADLDDDTMHKLFMALGVDPHEAEEFVYAALQRELEANPGAAEALAEVQEQEVDTKEDKEGGEKPAPEAEKADKAADKPVEKSAAAVAATAPVDATKAAANAKLAKLKRAEAEAKEQARTVSERVKQVTSQQAAQDAQTKLQQAAEQETQAEQELAMAQQQEQLQAQMQGAPFASMPGVAAMAQKAAAEGGKDLQPADKKTEEQKEAVPDKKPEPTEKPDTKKTEAGGGDPEGDPDGADSELTKEDFDKFCVLAGRIARMLGKEAQVKPPIPAAESPAQPVAQQAPTAGVAAPPTNMPAPVPKNPPVQPLATAGITGKDAGPVKSMKVIQTPGVAKGKTAAAPMSIDQLLEALQGITKAAQEAQQTDLDRALREKSRLQQNAQSITSKAPQTPAQARGGGEETAKAVAARVAGVPPSGGKVLAGLTPDQLRWLRERKERNELFKTRQGGSVTDAPGNKYYKG